MFVRRLQPVRNLRDLTFTVLVALCVDVLAKIVLMLAGPRFVLSAAVLTGRSTHPDTDALLRWLFLLHLPTALFAWVAFMLWLLEARMNAESLAPLPHRWFKIFILLGWLVPVANHWIPKQIVDDVWASSRPGGVRGDFIGRQTHSGLVWAWWISWVLANWMTPLSWGMFTAPHRPAFAALLLIDALFLLPSLVAVVLQIAVVLRVTQFQEYRSVLHRSWVRDQ
ncbi:DUF4328 domain-containing protein [Streptosporangium sp. NPDC051023]|uniref:DUF4328 domain-containing protein n=1 Tax=Streptosporangium sp. NPDC051023 TaxID=3155410 RepID=UPI00344D90F1